MSRNYDAWHRFVYRFIVDAYFARVTVINPERLPRRGPVLYLALHRNGAVDGFVYQRALGGPVFMISSQLRRNWFARLFFTGIAVTRTKDDGDRKENQDSLHECLQHLCGGGRLCVFPEGTSSLGPRHLPFKSGAAWLILEYLEKGDLPLQVVPVGIHYECPWSFRAKVEVAIGHPISLDLATGLSPRGRLKALKGRVQTALEEVGINVPTEENQQAVLRLAYVSTLATDRSYFKSLKSFEREIPEPILHAAKELEPELLRRRLLCHQGVALMPMGPVGLYILALAMFGPVVLAAILANLPPFLAGWAAGKWLPDDRNVISLWKILVGLPVFWLWMMVVASVCLATHHALWFGGYGALTTLGLILYYRVKKLAVAVHNGWRYPALKPRLLEFRETVLRNLPAES